MGGRSQAPLGPNSLKNDEGMLMRRNVEKHVNALAGYHQGIAHRGYGLLVLLD